MMMIQMSTRTLIVRCNQSHIPLVVDLLMIVSKDAVQCHRTLAGDSSGVFVKLSISHWSSTITHDRALYFVLERVSFHLNCTTAITA